MGLLLTASAASRIEKSGNALADICGMLSADRRARGVGLVSVVAMPGETLPCKREAIANARRTIASNSAIRAVDVLVRCGDDSVDLIRVGKRGGWKRITRVWDTEGLPV